ncbi:hypothetical protein KOW79_019289 [Hemibagrus wyckioides]|uniref:Scaffolding anchor of CK1 domain-containing protein n=1 Tax=Hemibagrus wyckioides TaxID=337641 RepID=A0A9D3N5H4_9TELE|nr:protein FAM83G [Hemibagrus wyckioides]KAG7316991.1 hypothetical protein KOW79_019289 [Hemibagrus wyckioides]
MALSQIECLNEYHVNLRTNESKPEFLYSEEQRLALERLLDEGPDSFQEFIKTNRIRPFLSDLELAQLSTSVEPYCPDLPVYSAGFDGDRAETRLSLQYWPERSDDSLPQLELGWPQRASYRGVTRVTVHAQPPLDGGAHIKEVIRRTIARAQKVIAVVMDLFTDVDIFKDLLYASFKRNVAVYIILDVTGVPHFLKMCESASMHTGHLKNLRVRSIRGTGFFTRSSKKVCGSQCQRFMFVDGDKAVSGSYSFTWTASRLDRSIITVLTGQAVDLFDQMFQDLYIMSNAVDMNKINLEKEQKLEPIFKAAPPLQPSTTMALKLINPKYALVSDAASNNHMVSETCTAKSNSIKQMKEVSVGPYIHPGLLHLEKANMIDYLPVWPEPDPPSDVIGFINIRDCNKPLLAHLTRSELFEVTQAIRFKDPIHIPQESLSEKLCPSPTSQNFSLANEQLTMQPQNILEEKNEHCNYPQQIFPPHSLKDQVVCLAPIPDPNPAHSSKKDEVNSPVDDGVENQTDVLSKQREKVDAENICTSFEPCKDSRISENPLIENITPSDSDECNTETTHTPAVQPETTSDKQSCENITETIGNKDFQDNQWNIQNLIEPDTHETDHVDSTGQNGNSIYSDSRSSFSSEEYFECRGSVIVDSESVGMVNVTSAVSRYPDEPNNATESLSGSCKSASSHEAIKETEESKLQCASPEECHVQHLTGVTADLELTSVIGVKGLSETVSIANLIQETDSTSQQGTESELLHLAKTDTHTAADENTECESYSVVNHMFDAKPVERNDSPESPLLVNKSLLQDHVAVPYVAVQKTAEAQCIVFSDMVNKVPLLRLNPEMYSGFSYASNLKSVPVDTDLPPLSKSASFNTCLQKENNPNTESGHKELSYQNKPLIAEESTNQQATEVKDMDNFNSEPKAAAQTVDKRLNPKILTGFKVVKLSVDIYPLKRKTLEHLCVQQESKNQPEVKSKLERNIRKLHRVSPQPKPIPTRETKLISTKASVTKLHSSNHLTTPAVSTPGVQNDLPARQLAQNSASNDLYATPAKLPRRHTVPIRSNQTRLRALQTELSADHHHSSQKQPQAQQDRMQFNQLHRSSFRQRSASTTEGRFSFRGTSFPKTSKSTLKERSADSTSQTNPKKSIMEKDKK